MAAPRSYMHRSPSALAESESEAKRRKIRKGTRSCWECKRRKVRCTFTSFSDAICVECQRRGTSCIGQEHHEDSLPPSEKGLPMSERMIRIESLVNRLVEKVENNGMLNTDTGCGRAGAGERAPLPRTITTSPYLGVLETSRPLALYEPSLEEINLESDYRDSHPPSYSRSQSHSAMGFLNPDASRDRKISEALYAAFPSPEDIGILWQTGAHVSIYFHRVMSTPYLDLERDGLDLPKTPFPIPGPDTHPVLLARSMFLMATLLQYLDPESHEQIKYMSEPPRVIMKRLADTAARLVTTNDNMLGTVEGLECVMMEGIYQANCGNLRRAWIAFRRAMVVGQLMGIHRATSHPKVIDPNTKFNAQFFWYRIVSTDRFLCFMLGLPQGSLDRSMATQAALGADTSMGRLERMHCVIASRILERNEADPGSYDFSTTQKIDMELQDAAKIMPSSWWLAPNLAAVVGHDESVFWEMLRLVNQLYHYNLFNQLHLPFMLRFNSDERLYGYSQIACANASREVLCRFITFRSFNRVAFCCRAVDSFALMASLTLLLAHLDSRRPRPSDDGAHASNSNSGSLNFLAHQYLGDRAIIEQVLKTMEELAHMNNDAICANSASLLRRLLIIEAEAANGKVYSIQREQGSDTQQQQQQKPKQSEVNVLRIGIPYFGTIRLTRQDTATTEMPPSTAAIETGPLSASDRETRPPARRINVPPAQPSHQLSEQYLFPSGDETTEEYVLSRVEDTIDSVFLHEYLFQSADSLMHGPAGENGG
ncbi:hypothetical protein F4775DRAFT_532855 [Biscogniauxia sp. FL1348]|nr:hypothetical protein F4775DRAFT_532855 [Biscogniauxia sp. FL1348]